MKYILSIDQSTSGTKALLFDASGDLLHRADLPHEQKINSLGWVSHDPMEIFHNSLAVSKTVIAEAGIDPAQVAAIGISNQRETSVIWDRSTGLPVADAIVWQCDRAKEICARLEDHAEEVRTRTGLPLSPYFPAGKWAWILENTPDLAGRALCAGTIDSWLVFKLTEGASFKTDYSNAARTELFNLRTLTWDPDLCRLFGIPLEILPEVCMSDSCFGTTTLDGFFPAPVPIYGVLGDSHGSLFGHGCLQPGMIKSTYGTGSSVMMNIGDAPAFLDNGIATSIAWGMDNKVTFVFEGNINYSASVIKWLVEDVQLLGASKESGVFAAQANPEDTTYLVPAFSGLGAPYWRSDARAIFCGMSRQTGKAEIVKACEESIAYQITDVITAMQEGSGVQVEELRADGGAAHDRYLMQFQSDILNIPVAIPDNTELSGTGAAYCAGIACGLYDKEILNKISRTNYTPEKDAAWREKHYSGWKKAVGLLLK